ncbi:MAG: hypothetical protein AAF351_13155 [Pseudomonadota bacterium]
MKSQTSRSASYTFYKPAIVLVLPLLLIAAATSALATDKPMMYPLLRYAIPDDGEAMMQYVGDPTGPFADRFEDTPRAESGPMIVDCAATEEIGVIIEPRGLGGYSYGESRKFRFQWTHATADVKPSKSMLYKRNTPQGFMRNRLKLKKWRYDGMVEVTVSVQGEVIYSQEFELQNCSNFD